MPIVSIILPTYKNPVHLTKSINSVLEQSFLDWELIIVNDGLTVEALEGLVSLTKKEQRIIILSNPENLGIQKSLNRGLSITRGKYIARIDDDDIWVDRDKLKKQVWYLDNNNDHVLIGTDAIICDEELTELGCYSLSKNDLEIRNRILFKNCFIHSTVLMRKDALNKIGGYAEGKRVRNVEDYDLWLRLGRTGKMANLDSKSTKIIISNSSITAKSRVNQARRDITLAITYRKYYPYFIFALIVGCTRFIFFFVNTIFPVPKKMLYKIQTLYKAI